MNISFRKACFGILMVSNIALSATAGSQSANADETKKPPPQDYIETHAFDSPEKLIAHTTDGNGHLVDPVTDADKESLPTTAKLVGVVVERDPLWPGRSESDLYKYKVQALYAYNSPDGKKCLQGSFSIAGIASTLALPNLPDRFRKDAERSIEDIKKDAAWYKTHPDELQKKNYVPRNPQNEDDIGCPMASAAPFLRQMPNGRHLT